jgi:tetratricopeptide (TPR) repeat protein
MRSVVRIREEAGRYTGSRLGCEGPECFVPAHLPTPTDTMNKLTQRDSHFGRVPSNSTKRVGNLAVYEECLAIRRRLAKVDPRNTQWQHDEACLLDQIGNEYRNAGMKRQAIAAYEASLAVLRHLAEIDPRNTQRQLDVAVSLNKLGDVKLDGVDSWGAITCYEASAAVWRHLLTREPNNARWQSNVAQNLEKIGDIKFAAGDSKGALTSYEEMLTIDRELVERDGSNVEWQRTLSLSLERMGDVRLALGHAMFAVTAYEESLAIRHCLIELDDSNIHWPEEISDIIQKIDHANRAGEEPWVTDQELAEVESPIPLQAGKESVSPSGDEAIARAKLSLLSFFALVKATRTRWQGESLLLNKLTKRATAVARSLRRAGKVRGSRPKELKPLSSCGGEIFPASQKSEFVESHSRSDSIQGEGDAVGSTIGELRSTTHTVFIDSAPNTEETKATNQASIKRSRRRRRRKRKDHPRKAAFAQI